MPSTLRALTAALAVLFATRVFAQAPPQPPPRPSAPPHGARPLPPPPGAAGLNQEPLKVQLPKDTVEKPPREAPPEVPAQEERTLDREKLRKKGRFLLDFDKVDIEKLVQTISDMTGRLFILPENIRGKISIIGPEHGKKDAGVTADEAYAAFLAALDANSLTLYPVGKFYKIVEKRTGKQNNIPTFVDEDTPYTTNEQMITRVFRMRYVEAEPIRAVLQQLVSREGDCNPFPPDVLICNDIGLNMHRLEKIIDRLDRPSSTDEIRVIQVQYAAATDLAERLKQIFEDKNKRPGQRAGAPAMGAPPPTPGAPGGGGEEGAANLSQIIPDERTNKLIIIANESAFRRIEGLLRQLDTPIEGEGQVHVYYLENASAEELASTLASLTQGIVKGPRPPTNPAPGAARSPATVADLFSGEIKITADKGTNSLVIIANNTDYKNVVNVIKSLDRPRNQVFIEAVIMEINLQNDKELGISVHGGAPYRLTEGGVLGKSDSIVVAGSEIGPAKSITGITSLATLGGFLAGLQGPMLTIGNLQLPSFAILIRALQTSSDVNVLSTPHILTSDNEDAEITVGQNVPFQAGYAPSGLTSLLGGASGSTNTGANSLLNNIGGLSSYIAPIQRQNVELKLKIKPQINESDYIRLTVDEQTEEIASESPTLGPTVAKRSAKTTVMAKDQQTVVIGGLMQERTVRSVEKTPILGDIPLIGRLFRSTTEKKTKTNLLLFLTPYIIRDQADFARIFERKMKERQEFVEQFYGRQPGYKVDIDYARKAGPLAKMFKSLEAEKQKAENGGPGTPGERLIKPVEPAAPIPVPEQRALPAPSTEGVPPPAQPEVQEPTEREP